MPRATGAFDAGPRARPSGFTRSDDVRPSVSWQTDAMDDTASRRARRPRAIEYSDWYSRRLVMHRIASYAELPLFAGEYVVGEQILRAEQRGFPPHSLRTAHAVVADGLIGLFAFNTVTGAWNLWDSRRDPAGRTRRLIHTALMLLSDAGFAATATAGSGARFSLRNAQIHRSLAEGSMGVALVGTGMMWFWRN
jgi:hypothetical protein